ncbi:MAG: pyridoxamine 5'-phosphate oxidase family protein [Deltaproteobacteria bacterium]|nr:pyridoxamine 5'-phosphate oxidase family protein [Deltaproteobacteria bacterium]
MTSPTALSPTDRTTLRRRSNRSADVDVFDAVLRECLVCHVAVVVEGQPMVLPTTFVRVGDEVFIHGAVGNGLLRFAVDAPVCFTAVIADALVFAKSAAHHSMNYRSVVAFARGREVVELAEKARVLDALLEKMRPGRSTEARTGTEQELIGVRVVALSLAEASAKLRPGPPVDDEADLAFPTWRGIVPLRNVVDDVVAC